MSGVLGRLRCLCSGRSLSCTCLSEKGWKIYKQFVFMVNFVINYQEEARNT
jgi:hypothetical protein